MSSVSRVSVTRTSVNGSCGPGSRCMRPDPRKYLWDAVNAAELARGFAQGRSFEDYLSNAMLRAAVEREFEIIGEALNQLSRVAPEIASAIPELPRIVAFRNILIHGYATVDDALVWQVLKEKLPELEQVIRDMLDGS
ncbi:HepT-like ribonuclease domain-containing protein [Candidatus Protofrankia californiensis]|uniref:HepT-like ribonuclease domain-containing protein n=1 Tax=Candidatus Protofrankia californiensis TaxID=1839754 RepID=UPI003204F0F5